MERKNNKYATIMGISITSLQIIATIYMTTMLLVYGLLYKGTQKGDSNVLTYIELTLRGYTILLFFVMMGILIAMIVTGLKLYRLKISTPEEYKNKQPTIIGYCVIQVLLVITFTLMFSLLMFRNAFRGIHMAVPIVFSMVSIALCIGMINYFVIEIKSNNPQVKDNSRDYIQETLINKKYEIDNQNKNNINDTINKK